MYESKEHNLVLPHVVLAASPVAGQVGVGAAAEGHEWTRTRGLTEKRGGGGLLPAAHRRLNQNGGRGAVKATG